MNHLSPTKTGLALGNLVGGIHLVWALLIAFGWAQGIVNFVLWAHMINLPVVIKPFDFTAAVTLVVITAIMGYVVGYALARIWNWLHR